MDRELRARGVSRGERLLVGELAEYLASQRFGIQLERNLVNASYDGVRDGIRYQIKARVVRSLSASTSWDFREQPAGFDILLAFLFDPDLRVLRVIEVPIAVVRELARPNRGRWSFRWNRALAQDPRVTPLA